jgi:hypothetical protein
MIGIAAGTGFAYIGDYECPVGSLSILTNTDTGTILVSMYDERLWQTALNFADFYDADTYPDPLTAVAFASLAAFEAKFQAIAYSAIAGGGATSAKQDTGNASLATISGQLPATLGAKATAASMAVTIASDQTVNISDSTSLTAFRRVSTGVGADKALVVGSAKKLVFILPINMVAVAALAYLKIYDAATAGVVTVGTTTPALTIPIPVAAVGLPPTPVSIPFGISFSSGIVIAITTGGLDNNSTAVAAGDVIIQLGYK